MLIPFFSSAANRSRERSQGRQLSGKVQKCHRKVIPSPQHRHPRVPCAEHCAVDGRWSGVALVHGSQLPAKEIA